MGGIRENSSEEAFRDDGDLAWPRNGAPFLWSESPVQLCLTAWLGCFANGGSAIGQFVRRYKVVGKESRSKRNSGSGKK